MCIIGIMENTNNLELNRFGIISALLIIVTIVGGIAGASVISSVPLLALAVGSTMLTEAFIIAVQPMKRILVVGFCALWINIGLLIYAGLFM